MDIGKFAEAFQPKDFRRFLAYLFTIAMITVVELKVNGGVSSNGQIALMTISGAYFGSVAYTKVMNGRNGKKEKGDGKPS